MKKLLFSATFVVAVVGAFAFHPRTTTVAAHYQDGASCNPTDQTREENCSTGNTGIQCTVNVLGFPPAWNQSNCTEALKQP